MKRSLKLFLLFVLTFCTQFSYAQVDGSASMVAEVEKSENEVIPQIFKDYSWLDNVINAKDCSGAKVMVQSKADSPHKFVIIEENGKRTMYNAEGKLYCTDSKELNCAEYYKLTNEVDTWKCK